MKNLRKMMIKACAAVFAFATVCSGMARVGVADYPAAAVALVCENAVNPFIHAREPRLSWKLDDQRQGAAQSRVPPAVHERPSNSALPGEMPNTGKNKRPAPLRTDRSGSDHENHAANCRLIPNPKSLWMLPLKVGTSGPLVRSHINGHAGRVSLPDDRHS